MSMFDRYQDSSHKEEGLKHRWMVSYADFMTILFCTALAVLLVSQRESHEKDKDSDSNVSATTTDNAILEFSQIVKAINYPSIKVIPVKEGSLINIPEKILFQSGDATILNEDAIKSVALKLAELDKRIVVSGHTDSVVPTGGKYSSNWELSAARASSVALILEKYGVKPSRITVQGRAAIDPVSTNETEEGRQKNRRVTIFVATAVDS